MFLKLQKNNKLKIEDDEIAIESQDESEEEEEESNPSEINETFLK